MIVEHSFKTSANLYQSTRRHITEDSNVYNKFAFTAQTVQKVVFWVVIPCGLLRVWQYSGGTYGFHHQSEGGGSKFFRNTDIHLQENTVLQTTRGKSRVIASAGTIYLMIIPLNRYVCHFL
jgi:hypothetical protein